ncbi:metallophosphoesterase [Flavobacterium sp. MAH-1]|uniref:Metallophosphoesterase n=1 Tax=Flavobacterium agri TaxID=2743471 RepID=A0A7Y8Y3H3_9FLAO|nr:metallophosphoesterase [Flavobacterium agri]NUY81793.1 metallophosphoesterase [Flavobacterium agri]NYA71817.1 metallophosphoesterase [Flavobacterium agri]
MKLFRVAAVVAENMRFVWVLAILAMLQSCATFKTQLGEDAGKATDDFNNSKSLSHTFFLIGDAGNWNGTETPEVFSLLSERLKAADSSSTLIFLGDNIYPYGLPKPDASNYADARIRLEKQIALAKNFKGKTIFIPGNHDYYNGLDGVKDQAKLVTALLEAKKAFLPRKGCGMDKIDIDDSTALIVVDSQWFLEDWDKLPSINEDCDIKTREMFFKELEDKINDYQNKTVILALHHPLMSNGAHGGEYSFHKHLFPLKTKVPMPVVGTVINVLRKTSGLSPQDLQNKKYNTFVKRVKTLVQGKDNVLVVSGHDHSLQYIDREGVRQVISGSGSKKEAARAIDKRDFSFGGNGFAEVKVLKNGATNVTYFSPESEKTDKTIFTTQALPARPTPNIREFPKTFAATKDTSVYTTKMTTKNGWYRFLWGKHYRKYYSMVIRANQAALDTLHGGLKPVQSGGGHQSMSLRLSDKNGKEYVMRAIKKSATRFLQTSAFRDQAVEKDFRNTYTENFLLDFYTTAHPYSAFAVANLSEDLGIAHSNPQLLYIPKQNPLGLYNDEFGDELYLVEERPMDKFKDLKSFGKPDKFVSTDDVLANIHADEKYSVDKKSWIKARMFDMLIGDWDRHQDQWRWGEYKEGDKIVYRPIPRDRDQAFSKIDGALLSLLVNIPALRHFKKFDEDLGNVKWFNRTGYPMDLAFVPLSTEEDWVEQAKWIEDNLSDAEIDAAFKDMPKEVQDETVERIKAQLKIRKTHLEKYAHKYYKVLQRTILVVGTEKKDKIVLTRSGKDTNVEVFRIKKDGSREKTFEKNYHRSATHDIWVYALGDSDTIEVKGKGSRKIRLRLLGGADTDTYIVEHGRKVTIYDFKSKNDDLLKAGNACLSISDDYDVNTYDYMKPKYNVFAGYPMAGFNPDDGIKLGAFVNYTVFGFDRNPFTQKHSLGGNYYFATSGFELYYNGTFPKAVGSWNLLMEARYTSPNFSQNFFGFGNETENHDDDEDMDFNRVKMRILKAAPTLQWVGEQGASANIQASFERISVDQTAGRFISIPGVVNADVFDYKDFIDVNGEYRFDNYDNVSKPTLGFTFSVLGGLKLNLKDSERNFPYAEGGIGVTYKLTPRGKFVLATYAKAKFLFNDEYEFYQAATVGGDSDLRGFRNQRFSGQQSFYQSTDLRWNIGKLKTSIVPLSYGILAGFDYGRVWLQNDYSDKWHQTVGGGIWVNGVNLITLRASYFVSSDGARVFAGLGFGF